MTFFESEDNALYAKPDWWESEYQKCKSGDSYEWFTNSTDGAFLAELLNIIPSTTSRIVNLGCGISHLQDSVFDAGFRDITNVDGSPACIQIMRESDTRGMKWQIANLTETFPFESASFDFAFDKGTLDAIITNRADQWEPRTTFMKQPHSTSEKFPEF
jgi:hypothetical protein